MHETIRRTKLEIKLLSEYLILRSFVILYKNLFLWLSGAVGKSSVWQIDSQLRHCPWGEHR